MLRVKEVADRLRVHPATVYRWIKDGHIQAVRYGQGCDASTPGGRGGSIRIPESAIAGIAPASVIDSQEVTS